MIVNAYGLVVFRCRTCDLQLVGWTLCMLAKGLLAKRLSDERGTAQCLWILWKMILISSHEMSISSLFFNTRIGFESSMMSFPLRGGMRRSCFCAAVENLVSVSNSLCVEISASHTFQFSVLDFSSSDVDFFISSSRWKLVSVRTWKKEDSYLDSVGGKGGSMSECDGDSGFENSLTCSVS